MPEATPDSFSGSRAHHQFPLSTGDFRLMEPTFTKFMAASQVENKTVFRFHEGLALYADNSPTTLADPQLCNMPVIYRGPAEALVHVSLSSTFSAGDLYAMYIAKENSLDASVNRALKFPVSWHGSHVTGQTRCQIPYGTIRKVYTASGVTMIQSQHTDADYSLAAQP